MPHLTQVLGKSPAGDETRLQLLLHMHQYFPSTWFMIHHTRLLVQTIHAKFEYVHPHAQPPQEILMLSIHNLPMVASV